MRNFEAPFPCAIFSYFFWIYKIDGAAFPTYVGRLRRGGGPPAIAELSAFKHGDEAHRNVPKDAKKRIHIRFFCLSLRGDLSSIWACR